MTKAIPIETEALTKLPKRLKNRWVKALRSGEYIQGESYLLDRNGGGPGKPTYCCLGVLGVLCKIPEHLLSGGAFLHEDACGLKVDPNLVLQNSDIPEDTPMQNRLAYYNDEGWSFKKIASYIERYL